MIFTRAKQFIIDSIRSIYGDREAENMAKILLEDLFGQQWIINHIKLTDAQKSILDKAIVDLKHHVPLQYITGMADFFGLKFHVNKHVLIPRPETEEMVDFILKEHPEDKTTSLLDIGTGSGCIPITIGKYRKEWRISAVDVCPDAIQVARKNASLNEVNIEFFEADILNNEDWERVPTVDIIVSNPPYIDVREQHLMKSNVLDYEPHLALFVYDEDPLLFYKKIIEFSEENLKSNGFLYFECNEFNAQELAQYICDVGFLQDPKLIQDFQGKDRMISCRKI